MVNESYFPFGDNETKYKYCRNRQLINRELEKDQNTTTPYMYMMVEKIT